MVNIKPKSNITINSIISYCKSRSPFSGNEFLCRNNLSGEILELKTSVAKTVMQLSAGTIVLTFTIIQYLSAKSILFKYAIFLKLSWIFLTLSVLFGLLFFYFLISHMVIFPDIKPSKNQEILNLQRSKNLYFVWVSHMRAELLQFTFFFIGIVFLGFFAFLNF